MNLKSKIEAIIYAAEDPVSIDQIAAILKEEMGEQELSTAKERVRSAVEELIADSASDQRGIEVRKIGWSIKFCPTSGRSLTTGMPKAESEAAGPRPERVRIAGE